MKALILLFFLAGVSCVTANPRDLSQVDDKDLFQWYTNCLRDCKFSELPLRVCVKICNNKLTKSFPELSDCSPASDPNCRTPYKERLGGE